MVVGWSDCESLALWPKSAQEYDSANNHNPMSEMRSLEQVRSEEIAQLLQEWTERNKKKHAVWKEAHKQEISAYNKEWNEAHSDDKKILEREWNEANRDHANEYGRERAKKAKNPNLFPCVECGKPFASTREWERPQLSEAVCKPKRDAARTARLTCSGCGEVLAQIANLERYLAGNYRRTVEEMSCSIYGRVIKNTANLLRHEATHKG
jgi:hypothetical protein